MQARLLNYSYQQDLNNLMSDIGVDRYGVKLMCPKGVLRIIHLSGVSSFAANIVKQEILSLGGDLAIPREALFKNKLIDCILIATESQIEKLEKKLCIQPYSLKQIGLLIKEALCNFKRETFSLDTPQQTLHINRPFIMGILNVTPDSFSGDGLIKMQSARCKLQDIIVRRVEEMVHQGADIIDVGGESTRPQAKPVSVKEEIERVMPSIKIIRKKYPKVPISIDTHKAQVAKRAIEEGACIVNDITALKHRDMARIVSRSKVGVVLMHMKGNPRTMQKKPFYRDVLKEIYGFLNEAIQRALSFGIDRKRIIVDIGIGFGKRLEDNLRLIKYLYEFRSLGMPVLIGVSRKSFIGKVLKKDNTRQRLAGTLTSLVISILHGAKILRVHDIGQTKEAIQLAQAIMSQ